MRSAVTTYYTRDLGHGPTELFVHHHEGCESSADALFFHPLGYAPGDLFFVVTPRSQACRLNLRGGWKQEDENGVGVELPHLLGSPQVDLEDYVLTGRRIGHGRAVEMTEELSRLEETSCRSVLLECLAIDERVRVGRLPGTPRAGRP